MNYIRLWNKEYGSKAQFVVENDKGQFTFFSPANNKDVAWVKTDLTEDDSVKNWDDWNKEEVENLADVMM